jgi:C4-dicarboxylate-specific signal transduction histidine kinase|tara:strand:- start:92 stop:400 length:309 start_codon:yes stop_codon:yes gene_type:complete
VEVVEQLILLVHLEDQVVVELEKVDQELLVLLHKLRLCQVLYNLLVLETLVELVLYQIDQVVVEVELEELVPQDQDLLVELEEMVNLYLLCLDQVLNLIIQE